MFFYLEQIRCFVGREYVSRTKARGELGAAPESAIFSLDEFHLMVAIGTFRRFRGHHQMGFARGEFEGVFARGFFAAE